MAAWAAEAAMVLEEGEEKEEEAEVVVVVEVAMGKYGLSEGKYRFCDNE